MAKSELEELREEVKQLVEVSGMREAEKKRWVKLIPHMLELELTRLKVNLLRQLYVDASKETINEIIETKKAPEDEGGLLELMLAKVLEKADKVEERTKRVVGN